MNNFRTYGNSPYTIAVIHGGPGAGGEMAPVARQLSTNWGVLEPIQTEKSIEKQIKELKGVIDKYGTIPIILVGYSWGAWLSLLFAAKYSLSIRKLILISCGPFEEKYVSQLRTTRTSRLSEEERTEFEEILTKLDSEQFNHKNRLFKRLGELSSKTDDFNPLKNQYDTRIQVEDSGDIYRLVWGEAAKLRTQGKLLEVIKSIKCPVSAIHGAYDPHPYEGVELPLFKYLAHFKFHLLEKCGHTPWLEKEAYKKFYKILLNEIG